MLEVKDIDQSYGESRTLWGVSFDLPEGSRTVLMGRNGVGKTTLLRCVMGIERISRGRISYKGEDLAGRATERRADIGIAYVPQGRDIFPRLTVEENLRTGLGRGGRKRIPDLVFELFPVLHQMRRRRGGDLSGGQQQQLAIGRALVLEPDVIILDEPTEGIQPNIVHEIGDIILRLNEELKLSVLLVEQKLPFARRVGDRFVLMDKGRVVRDGPMGELDEELIEAHLSV